MSKYSRFSLIQPTITSSYQETFVERKKNYPAGVRVTSESNMTMYKSSPADVIAKQIFYIC